MTSVAATIVVARRGARWTLFERICLAALSTLIMIVIFGPLLAPYSPYALVGIPYSGPSHHFWLGTDDLGRDVLSRMLYGGQSVLLLALTATAAAYVVGGFIGLIAGFTRSAADPILMRLMDVILAFPPILFLLVLATDAGHSLVALAIGVTLVHIPGISRIIRTASLEISVRGFVESAIARGEPVRRILVRDIVPNIRRVIVADAGPRFTVSILLVAGISFLGLGQRPPAANWALMINENREGFFLNPWASIGPAIVIALLTISVNVLADGIVRRQGDPGTQEPRP